VEWTKGSKAVHAACNPVVRARLEASRATAPLAPVVPIHGAPATTATAVPVPQAPVGLAYLPFQAAGIQLALARFSAGRVGVLIADEMGLGKTIQALGVCSGLAPAAEKPLRVLVVCPASLRLNWAREAARWLVGDWTVTAHIKAGKVQTSRSGSKHSLEIVNYDILSKVPCVHGTEWDVLVVDEAHYAKNSKAQRTKALAAIKADRRVFLTGTPICNRPLELHSLLTQIEPSEWGAFGEAKSFFKFAYRYCSPQKVWTGSRHVTTFTGASNLDELQTRLRTGVMVRRLKADVLKDLPPKTRQTIGLPANGCSSLIEEQWGYFGGDSDRAEEELERGALPAFSEFSRVRREIGMAKVTYVVDHVTQALADDDSRKIVVMAHHHEVVAGLVTGLAEFGAVKLDGTMDAVSRDAAVTRFQTDPTCRVFVGSIMAAGVGITLTAAHHVVFAELDWVPGNISQAEDRCHRIGQRDNVLVQHLVFEGSLDEHLLKTIIAKQEVITRGLDETVQATDAPAKAASAQVAAPDPVAPQFSQEVHDAALRGLRLLSSRCDGAVAEDGCGFNGRDSQFGKDLARYEELTPRQLRAAVKMLRTYRNTQLPREVVAVLEPAWEQMAKK
jgi:SWI/SNF-related matrix-associated actin-dependent regulator 1 of chromatin subfamily A